MQYPVPAWPQRAPYNVRSTRLDPDSDRYRHLPLVTGRPDKGVTVLRGDRDDVLATIGAGYAYARDQYEMNDVHRGLFLGGGELIGHPHFLIANRLGRVNYIATGKLVRVGILEELLYSDKYVPSPDIANAKSMAEARAALAAEADRLDALEADGWELVDAYEDGGHAFLVDTTRPDEKLTRKDLP